MPLFFMKKDVVIDKVGDQLVIVKKERHSQNKYILEQKFRKKYFIYYMQMQRRSNRHIIQWKENVRKIRRFYPIWFKRKL